MPVIWTSLYDGSQVNCSYNEGLYIKKVYGGLSGTKLTVGDKNRSAF